MYLNLRKSFSTILTREPGGTKSAELIRKLILDDYLKKMIKINLINILIRCFFASRNEHVNSKIKPALKKGKIVICDRSDSTHAYQVYGKKLKKVL